MVSSFVIVFAKNGGSVSSAEVSALTELCWELRTLGIIWTTLMMGVKKPADEAKSQ